VADGESPPEPGTLQGIAFFGDTAEAAERSAMAPVCEGQRGDLLQCRAAKSRRRRAERRAERDGMVQRHSGAALAELKD